MELGLRSLCHEVGNVVFYPVFRLLLVLIRHISDLRCRTLNDCMMPNMSSGIVKDTARVTGMITTTNVHRVFVGN